MQLQLNRDNFHQTLKQFSTSQLETMIEKFPYFQQAHLLLAKKYQEENNPRFDEQLQMAALYTQDRDLLFTLFNEVVKSSPILTVKPLEEIIPEETAIVNEPRPETPVEVKEDIAVLATEQEQPEVNAQAEMVPTVEESISERFTNLVTTETEINAVPQTTNEVEENIAEQIAESVTILEEHKETFNTSEPHTFDEWLKAFALSDTPKLQFVSEPLPVEPDRLDEELNKMILQSAAVNLHELVEEATNYSKGLNEFIGEQIQKHKPTKTKAPANENEMPAEIATETLAKLYEAQKKYQKAIRVYQVLQLKYPEKNDFFAARINYLKNLL